MMMSETQEQIFFFCLSVYTPDFLHLSTNAGRRPLLINEWQGCIVRPGSLSCVACPWTASVSLMLHTLSLTLQTLVLMPVLLGQSWPGTRNMTRVLWLCSLRWHRMMPASAQEAGFIKWFIFYTLEFSQPFLVIPTSHHCPANCWLSKSENSILLSEAASGGGLKEKSSQLQPLIRILYFLVVKLL